MLRNVSAALAAAGTDLAHVVKATVHLADLSQFEEFDAAYGEFFSDPKPARTAVGSVLAGIKVEIVVVAVARRRTPPASPWRTSSDRCTGGSSHSPSFTARMRRR